MVASSIAGMLEDLREETTEDTKFYKTMLMFFELKVPDKLAGPFPTKYLFPLRIMPESYTLDEPFTLEATSTQGGGLYVEENGINQRVIRLSGTTGFKPRPAPGTGPMVLALSTNPEKKSFTRALPPCVLAPISGQRQFQYLQDAVFRTYADLKRDPTTAEDTKLMLHIPKDDEHWLIAPRNFQLERTKGERVLYRYNIELLVVDKAEIVDADWSEDKSWLDQLKDAIAEVKNAIALVQSAVNTVTAMVAEIKNFIQSVVSIIDAISSVISAVSDFIDGITELVKIPFAVVDSLCGVIDSISGVIASSDALYDAVNDVAKFDIHGKIQDTWDTMARGFHKLGVHPEIFEPDNDITITGANTKTDPITDLGPTAIAAANAVTIPTTIAQFNALGSQMTPSDVSVAQADSSYAAASQIGQYKSANQVSLGADDTLASLAATYLRDARLWQDIAIVNGLQPPFLNSQASLSLRKTDETALPGVLGIGDKILIPSLSKGQLELPNLATLGVLPTESAEVHFLGRDIKLEMVSGITNPGNPLYDIPIDTIHGNNDCQVVAGIDNLKQGLTTRLLTERGTDILYKRLGMDRVIGTRQVESDTDLMKFRATQALLQDTRIANVRKISLVKDSSITPDAAVMDATVEVRGFNESSNVRIPMR